MATTIEKVEFDFVTFKGTMTVKDQNGNSIFYSLVGGSYKTLTAQYSGALYDFDGIRWKRCKRGAVSYAFYEWYEEMRKIVYNQFFNLQPNNHNKQTNGE